MEKLGEILVREKVISSSQLQIALREQKTDGKRLGSHLAKLGFINENELVSFLSKHYGVPSINLAEFEIDDEVIKLVPKEVAQKYTLIPVNKAGASLIVSMLDPSDIAAIDDLKFLTGYNVEIAIAPESAIKEAIEKYYAESVNYDELLGDYGEDIGVEFLAEDEEMDLSDLAKSSEEAPVVKFVNYIVIDAIRKGASDIHIEPYEKSMRVRYRIDGVLYEVQKPPRKLKDAIVSRIKIMSSLDIAERRLPQDGRIKMRMGKGREVDFRVSTMPTLFGEKVVLRILDKEQLQVDMTKLGFEEKALKDFKNAIYQPYGMVLVTGPTGSGKTTTLYSSLLELNKITTNISTAEDPVEYNLPGINQVQMHEDIGLNFAASLRTFLRQDPDIIMVGEIRDFETAEIAIKAALTGHLVLSTLHTNDAPATITRLLNMGVEPFLIASSLNLVVAQRLCRKICEECKELTDVPPQSLIDIGVNPDEIGTFKVFRGVGCATCATTGYKGRIGLYEALTIAEEVKEFVLSGASHGEIKKEAIRLGMKTLRQSAIGKLKLGLTSIDEVIRNTMTDR